MWDDIISELEKRGCVGDAFPVRCNRHPDRVEHISEAGQLPRISPDGSFVRCVVWYLLTRSQQVVASSSVMLVLNAGTSVRTRSACSPSLV